MVSEYTDILTEDTEFLSLMPVATFGYLYHLTGFDVFLIISLILVTPAALVIESSYRGYSILGVEERSLLENTVLMMIMGLFLIGLIAGPSLLLVYSGHTDLISVGLIISNYGLLVYSYSDKFVDYLGEDIRQRDKGD